MNSRSQSINVLLAAGLLAMWLPLSSAAKGYSSGGGHSYSSHSSSSHSSSFGSSHSSSFGSGFSSSRSSGSSGFGASSSRSSSGGSGFGFSSGSGKSYSSGSSWSGTSRSSYSSGKSYSSSPDHVFSTASRLKSSSGGSSGGSGLDPGSSSTRFNFDTAAARARKEESSKSSYTQYRESQTPPVIPSRSASASSTPPLGGGSSPSYRVQPPPIAPSRGWSYHPTVYIPDRYLISTRRVRFYSVFSPYSAYPVVTYSDPYSSVFWWWLLDRSLDDRAWWAYHHRYDMDPARYQALMATDQQLETRVSQLEAQQAARDPNYTPTGLQQDLMYNDHFVANSYSNRPTTSGRVAFYLIGVPTALGGVGFFIWLIWFKRWN